MRTAWYARRVGAVVVTCTLAPTACQHVPPGRDDPSPRTATAATSAVSNTRAASDSRSFLFVWVGGKGESEFMATVDADPASATYGRVLAVAPTGVAGFPHHTEHELSASGHLLANDFHADRTYLFDLHQPLHPTLLGSFGDVAGYSHPHTFVRMSDGRVLSTFQYRADSSTGAMSMHAMPMHATGGLVLMDERGTPVMSGSASDAHISDRLIYPYSVLPLVSLNRALSTTTDMDHADTVATSEWVQLWRLSDLALLKSFALPPGPRGTENRLSGEPRLLGDGRSVYVHTFSCGLYLVRGIEHDQPSATFVHGFEGDDCGVPILAGHYWLQTVPAMHGVVVLDVADPAHPREVSRASVGAVRTTPARPRPR